MRIPIANIPIQTLAKLSEAAVNARQRGTYLGMLRRNLPPLNLWLIGAGGVFTLLLLIADQWSGYYWYVTAGVCLVYMIARQFQKWSRWRMLGKDAVFFDPLYFISITGSDLQALPLSHFIDSDIMLAMGGAQYVARFHFQETSIVLPCLSSNDENIQRFQALLKQYCSVIKQSIADQKAIQELPQTFRDRIATRRASLISASFALVLLWFSVPVVIDRNQYRSANENNTATAYRTYLGEPRNLRYREIARADINNLYNLYIQSYRSSASTSPGANAFAQVIEYLRDKNLYTVRMLFYPRSELIDLPPSTVYHIIPVTPSFSPDKNQSRHEQVISTVKASLGQLFPTDIMTVASEQSAELPGLEVYYTYRNNPETIYYPVKEEHLSERSRTWYYGIEIDWWFRLSLPTPAEPLYEFNLISQPAQQFSSESFSADAVYTNMALSAFKDFEAEFHKRFFNWQ